MEIKYYNHIYNNRIIERAEFNNITFSKKKDYYVSTTLMDNGKKISLHHYIYCFYNHMSSIPEGYVVHHIDGNKSNNDISNLKLLTRSQHSSMHSIGENNGFYGKKHSQEKLEEISQKICKSKGYTNKSKKYIPKYRLSEEVKSKISNSLKGKNNANYIMFTEEQINFIINLRLNGHPKKKLNIPFNEKFNTKYSYQTMIRVLNEHGIS